MSNSRSRTARTASRTRSGSKQAPGPVRAALGFDRWIVVAFVLVVIVAGVLFLALRGDEQEGSVAGGGLEHVHGLGVDREAGVLYAGSHFGLFRLPEQGDGVRVADRVQDFMGFTVAGPDHFLASGHPGEGQDGPSALGLIESTDGGRTWDSLSLAGEADFHALEARHGQVYGFNAMTGAFMVSADKRTWETRSRLPMADFAISPDDPDVVIATTEGGLARSDDGGRTFEPVDQAPTLLLVTWTDDGTILGVQPDGQISVSTDNARTWQDRGRLDGPPEALTAVSDSEVYAAVGGTVVASTDGGRTFELRYSDQ